MTGRKGRPAGSGIPGNCDRHALRRGGRLSDPSAHLTDSAGGAISRRLLIACDSWALSGAIAESCDYRQGKSRK
ncbi:hypothetical protein SBBP2_1040028 [Burkholderiales bacterium]|nr:hypothetical protein SBBP2_1040028 [Burkholderiales bacterium]